MRGLKHIVWSKTHKNSVASFTDAWIETQDYPSSPFPRQKSHLLQMRGLKPINLKNLTRKKTSHLLQMRGLKLLFLLCHKRQWRRIFYRCVDWNITFLYFRIAHRGRIFYRCVDWNHKVRKGTLKNDSRILKRIMQLFQARNNSRIFYRCVDWNDAHIRTRSCHRVASFTDAWIETHVREYIPLIVPVASFTDAWIETRNMIKLRNEDKSHLLQMRGLKLWCMLIGSLMLIVASFTDAWIETPAALVVMRSQ